MNLSTADRDLQLVVATWYGVLALIAVAFLVRVLRQPDLRVVGRRHPRLWLLSGLGFGSAAFFIGCGLHHLRMARLIATGQHHAASTGYGVTVEAVQAVGAPLATICLVILVRRYLTVSIGARPEIGVSS